MRPNKAIRPLIAEEFRCIAASCEDTCCHGWSVPIGRKIFAQYEELPESPLRTQIISSIARAPEGAASSEGYGPEGFAKIEMDHNNQCPLLSPDHLCRIHSAYGPELLSHSCAAYPRIDRSMGGCQQQAMALSCPEAARLVLLNPLRWVEEAPPENEGDGMALNPPFYWEVRNTIFRLVRNRTYPLWQRIFLLGILCRRLDSIFAGELNRSVPEFLNAFERAVASGRLQPAMKTAPVDSRTQLDAVLRLAGLLLHKSNVTARFVECINTFAAGIGNRPDAALESLTEHYVSAHDRYFDPYFKRNPQILENYLINTIVRCKFPYGGIEPGAAPAMMREFAMLTAQFALTKGLLIGVAGFHKEKFSAAHVVHTVQAAAKHFDHYPEFPKLAYELLVESRLDGAGGISILLRNTDRAKARGVRPAVPTPGPHAEALP